MGPSSCWWEVFFLTTKLGYGKGWRLRFFILDGNSNTWFLFQWPFLKKKWYESCSSIKRFFNTPPKTFLPYNFWWTSPPSFSHSSWPEASRSIKASRRNKIWPRRRPWTDEFLVLSLLGKIWLPTRDGKCFFFLTRKNHLLNLKFGGFRCSFFWGGVGFVLRTYQMSINHYRINRKRQEIPWNSKISMCCPGKNRPCQLRVIIPSCFWETDDIS